MDLTAKLDKIDSALPTKALSWVMIGIGVTFILVGIYSKSNLLKATMIAYTIAP